jgi:hypothetical protein
MVISSAQKKRNCSTLAKFTDTACYGMRQIVYNQKEYNHGLYLPEYVANIRISIRHVTTVIHCVLLINMCNNSQPAGYASSGEKPLREQQGERNLF